MKARQLGFVFKTWGGKRKGAGRPRAGERRVKHVRRPLLKERFPVHVTWRMKDHVWSLRAKRCLSVLQRVFSDGQKANFQIVHYSVMGNHVHLLAEATDARALARGMQGLGIRAARRLNQVMERRGSVLNDRYHARILRTPTEVKRVRFYLLNNARHHFGKEAPAVDWCASQIAVHEPRTWLVRQTC
jgi:REP element-mobilizing transposase RayT